MLWTPRSTHIGILSPTRGAPSRTQLFPLPRKSRFTFKPAPPTEYIPPPPEKSKVVEAETVGEIISAGELHQQSDELLKQAEELAGHAQTSALAPPPLAMQLGLLVICKEDFINRATQAWDNIGRGEFTKVEFRINLRKVGLEPSAADADSLFDSWDRDGGGSLDLAELKAALARTGEKARAWRNKSDPNAKKGTELRARAKHLADAAEATRAAERLETELKEMQEIHTSSAEIRLGEFLMQRCIKPGAVVTQWSTSRGVHANELSRRDFRVAVKNLGLANSGVSEADIDGVFKKFDADGGGYLDAQEATAMVKELQSTAKAAQQERWHKETVVATKRSRATKMEALARAPEAEGAEEPRPIQWDSWLKLERQNSLIPEGVAERKQRERKEKKAQRAKKESARTPLIPKDSMALELAAAPAPAVPPSFRIAEMSSRIFDSAMRAVSAPFGSRGGGGGGKLTETQRTALRVVLLRLQRHELSLAWNSWLWRMEENRRVKHAIRAMLNPMRARAMHKWQAFLEERNYANGLLRDAILRMNHGAKVEAMARWHEFVRHAMRSLEAPAGPTTIDLCAALARCIGRG